VRIAIVGTGIAGLGAAQRLWRAHDLTLFEAGDHVGGHTHTHQLEIGGAPLAVDSGFIVFNERNYPRLCRLFRELDVAWQASDMSFSVRVEPSGLEWAGENLDTLYAQRKNLLRVGFQRMVYDIWRFGREAEGLLTGRHGDPALGEWLERRNYSREFVEHYLVPMGSAIWSAPPGELRQIPARFLVQFFENHGMLSLRRRPQWLCVRGGSQRYVEALIRPFVQRIRLRTPVRRVRRLERDVELDLGPRGLERFDQVVLATHSDQALRLLADPSAEELAVLGAIPYQENEALLHTDARLLPRRRKCWSSWNYHVLPAAQAGAAAAVSYWMNRLQSLATPEPLLVTLNHGLAVDPARVLRRMRYHHPLFTRQALRARERKPSIDGQRRTWFCGAYWGWGFHEDGLASGQEVASAIERLREPLEVRA
jgi:predicted NAD/FAD-binding protein